MYVENELVETVITDDCKFEEIVEEYEEEILVQEEVPESLLIDSADTMPAQDKPRCITPYFFNHCLYILCALCYRNFMETTCINISVLRVLLVQVRVAAMLRFSVA